jgi:hypothetical protein
MEGPAASISEHERLSFFYPEMEKKRKKKIQPLNEMKWYKGTCFFLDVLITFQCATHS